MSMEKDPNFDHMIPANSGLFRHQVIRQIGSMLVVNCINYY